ncbi:putative 2-aminoethylphosphonate ABC transporter ATP-binding protein [soil metagenome]
MTLTPLLAAQSVTKRFGATTVLDRVSLDIASGEFVCLLGPSGCGKTTLLRILCGIETATEGRVLLEARDITHLPAGARRFGVVFQSYALFPNLSAEDNIAYGLQSSGMSRADIRKRSLEMLELVGLASLAKRYPVQLSGGQQQRIALARALAMRPPVLLLAEPLSALDAQVRANLRGEIRSLQRRLGITTIMVTHDQDEALSMGDRVVVMQAGRIEQQGTPRELYADPQSRFVASFVGRMNLLPATMASSNSVTVGSSTLECLPSAIAPGSALTVGIRPELITLDTMAGAAANSIAARVIDTAFFGHRISTRLQCSELGCEIEVDLPISAMDVHRLEPDAAVRLTLPAASLALLQR